MSEEDMEHNGMENNDTSTQKRQRKRWVLIFFPEYARVPYPTIPYLPTGLMKYRGSRCICPGSSDSCVEKKKLCKNCKMPRALPKLPRAFLYFSGQFASSSKLLG